MTVSADSTIEAVIKRQRLFVLSALAIVVALSWTYLFGGAGMSMSGIEMTRLSQLELTGNSAGQSMMMPAVWTPGYAVLMFIMWWIMMVAMMLPSAAAPILLFATVNRRQRECEQPYVATGIFVAGYLAAWAGFSLLAVILQWAFERSGILSPTLVANNPVFGAVLLLAAGLYQLTPMKHACLRQCRSPLAFLSTHWRRGSPGAFRMGLLHGAFCVGCCWILMGLMFVGGAMNLYWIAGLALYLLLEKSLPVGHGLGHIVGIVLIFLGTATLALGF